MPKSLTPKLSKLKDALQKIASGITQIHPFFDIHSPNWPLGS